MRPMVKLLSPHICIRCGGQLSYTALFTTRSTKLIDPKTGHLSEDLDYEEFDDADEYIECTQCHALYDAKYNIDNSYNISYYIPDTTIINSVEIPVQDYPEGTIFRENVFYEF